LGIQLQTGSINTFKLQILNENSNKIDYDKLEKHFDKLEIMKKYQNINLTFDSLQLDTRILSRSIYSNQGNFAKLNFIF